MCALLPGGLFSVELLEERAGFAVLRASGRGVREVFGGEAGGHRWQRVPPNEKRGRVHTSTVTVAILDEPSEIELPQIDPRELDVMTCRASGAGGQNIQKTDSAVQIRHIPSGLVVRCETEPVADLQQGDCTLDLACAVARPDGCAGERRSRG